MRYLFLLLLLAHSISVLANAVETPATAFYYASHIPVDLLSAYQRVVVEPDNVTAAELKQLKQKGARVYAYFSIGEVGADRRWLKDLQPSWILGTNSGWKSAVMDLTQSGWRDYVIKKQLQALTDRGFEGFFLDTMDSYQLFAKSEAAQRQQQQGMVALIKSMKQQFPNVHLLFNRGFEVLDQVAPLADGVIAESLFKRWDPVKSVYVDVPENDRTWLLNKLTVVRDKYALPVTVLDYLPPEQRALAKDIADKIKALGFIPWISTPALDYMGVGALDLVPRKVLYLYDSKENLLPYTEIHRFLAMPLEYLGYVPEYVDIRTALPDYSLTGRYAGIVVWLNTNKMAQDKHFSDWILKQIEQHFKIAFVNFFPFTENEQLTKALNVKIRPELLAAPITLNTLSPHIGFEIQPLPRRLDMVNIQIPANANSWLHITSADLQSSDPVFTSDWGGMALAPYVLFDTEVGQSTEKVVRWIIDPFEFLKTALQLTEIPVADPTTESGRRILTAHIDGDGFYNKTELEQGIYSSELIFRDFIQQSKLPHTVSIIEGEISVTGLKPALSPELETLARKIFKQPNVELASHSYSHPFNWAKAVDTEQDYANGEGDNSLPIKGYQQFSVEREVAGSVNYINNNLAPPSKKTKVMLWTGNSLPNEEALGWANSLNITNMNGGNTTIRQGLNSLVNVSSSGIVRGAFFQPYAPIQNENVYTNNWLGPFAGYQQVLETFKLTGEPRRLKPISIYYHFYSGDKIASVQALHRVYDWAQAQPTLPLWISEYTPRLLAFRSAVYERLADGWRIHGAADLKTLRLKPDVALPAVSANSGIVGYQKTTQGLYVALSGQDTVTLTGSHAPASSVYLDNSNAQVVYWHDTAQGVQLRFKGHLPVTLALGNMRGCVLKDQQNNNITGKQQHTLQLFQFDSLDTGDIRVSCG